jgi:hypothetical protein
MSQEQIPAAVTRYIESRGMTEPRHSGARWLATCPETGVHLIDESTLFTIQAQIESELRGAANA